MYHTQYNMPSHHRSSYLHQLSTKNFDHCLQIYILYEPEVYMGRVGSDQVGLGLDHILDQPKSSGWLYG